MKHQILNLLQRTVIQFIKTPDIIWKLSSVSLVSAQYCQSAYPAFCYTLVNCPIFYFLFLKTNSVALSSIGHMVGITLSYQTIVNFSTKSSKHLSSGRFDTPCAAGVCRAEHIMYNQRAEYSSCQCHHHSGD